MNLTNRLKDKILDALSNLATHFYVYFPATGGSKDIRPGRPRHAAEIQGLLNHSYVVFNTLMDFLANISVH